MMPFELWWWVLPMVKTGLLFLFLFGIPALWIDNAKPNNLLSTILLCIALAPLLISACSVIVWIFANVLIFIWR